MTDYRDRKVKALFIPADERMAIGKPETKTIREWLEFANIKYMGFVNASSKIPLSLIIDEDGLQRGLPWNPRAHYLCGYPTDHPVVGNGLMVSMAMVDMGMDAVDLTPEAESVLAEAKQGEQFEAWLRQPMSQGYFHEYRLRFPQPGF